MAYLSKHAPWYIRKFYLSPKKLGRIYQMSFLSQQTAFLWPGGFWNAASSPDPQGRRQFVRNVVLQVTAQAPPVLASDADKLFQKYINGDLDDLSAAAMDGIIDEMTDLFLEGFFELFGVDLMDHEQAPNIVWEMYGSKGGSKRGAFKFATVMATGYNAKSGKTTKKRTKPALDTIIATRARG